jgi:hypothetical protein
MRNPKAIAALATVEAVEAIDLGGQRRLDTAVEDISAGASARLIAMKRSRTAA